MKKPMSLILVMLLLFGLVMPTFAQDGGPITVNCNGLSDADCQLLIDSAEATSLISSFTIPAMRGEFSLTVGEETLDGKVSGSAAMVLPGSLIAMMSDMQAMQSMTNMQPLVDFYSQLSGEKLMQMLAEMGLHVTLDELALNVPGEPPLAIRLEMIFKDMSLYIRMPSPAANDQWFGDTLEVGESELAELDAMFEELILQLQNEETQQAMSQLAVFEDWANDLSAMVNSYVVTTRGADQELMGQSMAVFTTTFNLKGLLADPELPALFMSLLEHPALAEMDMDLEDIQVNETQVQFLLMTVSMLLKDVTISTTQFIGLDDQFAHRLEMDATLEVDLSLLGDPSITGLSGSAHFEADMSDINSTTMDAVEVPAEFRSLNDMDGFLVGGPAMIEGELALGQTFSGSFEGDDDQDIFALPLTAGQTVQIEIVSDDYPSVKLYGPDGFLLDEMDTYFDQAIELTADADGVYLIAVEAYWSMDYDLTVRVP